MHEAIVPSSMALVAFIRSARLPSPTVCRRLIEFVFVYSCYYNVYGFLYFISFFRLQHRTFAGRSRYFFFPFRHSRTDQFNDGPKEMAYAYMCW